VERTLYLDGRKIANDDSDIYNRSLPYHVGRAMELFDRHGDEAAAALLYSGDYADEGPEMEGKILKVLESGRITSRLTLGDVAREAWRLLRGYYRPRFVIPRMELADPGPPPPYWLERRPAAPAHYAGDYGLPF
jgi:hypothetical protein